MKALIANGRKTVALDMLPPGLESIISDKHWVEENLLCLLSNAVKYSSEGVIRAFVTLDLDAAMVRVTVEDTGIGISRENKLLLFKQFSKVQSNAVGSTGLGLYSLLMRTEAIGGTCGVQDRNDNKSGSAFWFTFPYRPDVIMHEKDDEVPVKQIATVTSRALNLLLVDDSASVVKILTNRLVAAGHRVVTASNGSDGLDMMLRMRDELDLVIMDVQMPVMDGIEATRRYRESERNDPAMGHLPIILSSANSGDEVEIMAMALGVDAFLPKPFSAAALNMAIEAVSSGPLLVKRRFQS
jgi:CheY-like chemotaxis protein